MIRYTFDFGGGDSAAFQVEEGDLPAGGKRKGDRVPAWAELERFRCSHCPLPVEMEKGCPTALSLLPVIEAFRNRISYERVAVEVEAGELNIRSTTSAQVAIRSLVGLLMALSDCPIMMKLRPMAHFHVPFGGRENTVFRVVGMYLLAQYLRRRDGLDADWDLSGLSDLYRKLHVINDRMADRVRAASKEDATLNSLIILDAFAHAVEQDLKTHLAKWAPMFAVYLAEG